MVCHKSQLLHNGIIDYKFIVVLKWTGELKLREDITPQTYPRPEVDKS